MADKLIGFISYAKYTDDCCDYKSESYGVAIENGEIVEWSAEGDIDGNGIITDNYFHMSYKYGPPVLYTNRENDACYDHCGFDYWDFQELTYKLWAAAWEEVNACRTS